MIIKHDIPITAEQLMEKFPEKDKRNFIVFIIL